MSARRSSGGGKREENKALSALQLLDYSFGDLCGFISYSRDKKSKQQAWFSRIV
jgi:hypothetical protein